MAAAEQDVGRNIFQNKWGTKARILVMVGGGHAALVQRCLIYVRPGVRISKDPGVRYLEDLAGTEVRRSKGSFPYLILHFLDIAGHSQIPGSHTFCLPLFVVCVALLFAFVDGG